jgi:hypothetical protein
MKDKSSESIREVTTASRASMLAASSRAPAQTSRSGTAPSFCCRHQSAGKCATWAAAPARSPAICARLQQRLRLGSFCWDGGIGSTLEPEPYVSRRKHDGIRHSGWMLRRNCRFLCHCEYSKTIPCPSCCRTWRECRNRVGCCFARLLPATRPLHEEELWGRKR